MIRKIIDILNMVKSADTKVHKDYTVVIVYQLGGIGIKGTEKEKPTVDFTNQLEGPKDLIRWEFF